MSAGHHLDACIYPSVCRASTQLQLVVVICILSDLLMMLMSSFVFTASSCSDMLQVKLYLSTSGAEHY